MTEPNQLSPVERAVALLIRACIQNKPAVLVLIGLGLFWGFSAMPFAWNPDHFPRDPVPVDAIPDTGENQQIVFSEWKGHSPRDIEDQVTYPLSTALQGVAGVKSVRGYSYFGFSSILVIFEEDVDYYWSRSRILEKLNSLSRGVLPAEVSPTLGPDGTALGQIFWYTLEGRDEAGRPTGGWDLQELRSIQDWYVRYALAGAQGVAEVASVGGYVREYQVDVNPDAMRVHNVTLDQVFHAVRMSNQDVGARNIEINRVEYLIRGLGLIQSIEDLENAVVVSRENVPIYVGDVARVQLGPAQRRGVLDKEGAEVVGGVVVARYGENPLQIIENVKEKIQQISAGLPSKTLADGTVSRVTVVPFYDRAGLIHETLDTLKTALSHEMLVTVLVIVLLLMNLRGSLLVSALVPLAVLLTFIAMQKLHVDANIVALSGIAIAIGTMVDMGIVMVENMVRRLEAEPDAERGTVVLEAAVEVGGAVFTAVATTVISFLPVFTMEAAEGKLFRPLAFTKTFALIAAIVVSLVVIPPAAHWLFGRKPRREAGLWRKRIRPVVNGVVALVVLTWLTSEWMPLGIVPGLAPNLLFVGLMVGGILLFFMIFQWFYPHILRWALAHRVLFLSLPLGFVVLSLVIQFGFDRISQPLPESLRTSRVGTFLEKQFPGLQYEFMPDLDEGSFLYMPTTSMHAAVNEGIDILQKQDMGFTAIPEIESAVGKLGRADSPLDPAPISMIETVINYKSQFLRDQKGRIQTFRFQEDQEDLVRNVAGEPVPAPDGEPYKVRGSFERDDAGALIPDEDGRPFRLWRPPLDPSLNPDRQAWAGIRGPDDIWDEIVRIGKIPGATSAPKLQPIEARIVMLQSGMRAPMGIKVKGGDLETIERVGIAMEAVVKGVPGIRPDSVIADRIVGKPYLEFHLDRKACARYGLKPADVLSIIEVAIGGKTLTTTVEGRARYPVRVRYQRGARDDLEALQRVQIPTPDGAVIPLEQIAQLVYQRGPQLIKSEDTFLTAYVLFDGMGEDSEVTLVERVKAALEMHVANGSLEIPPGVSYEFAGNYQNQQRAMDNLLKMGPMSLALIFLLLYFQFRSVSTTLAVFGAVAVAWSGGFLLLWLYGQPWFLDLTLFGINPRDLFGMGPINLSVAVWVGFLALFGIATDDGVIIATYLRQRFNASPPTTVEDIRDLTLTAGMHRVRPAVMTSATTVIALIPVLTSEGRGSSIMRPMAIPTFGGMLILVVSMFTVPVLYSWVAERRLKRSSVGEREDASRPEEEPSS